MDKETLHLKIQEKYDVNVAPFVYHTRVRSRDLDRELIEHAQWVYEVNSLGGRTSADREATEHTLKYVYAVLYQEIREDAQRANVKLTEGNVDAGIRQDAKYMKAQDELVLAALMHEEVVALREAYKQKGFLLKELAQMVLQGFSTLESVSDPRS